MSQPFVSNPPQDSAPPEKIRCFLSTGKIIGQYIGTLIVSSIGLGLIVLFQFFLPVGIGLLASVAAFAGVGIIVVMATHNDYRWIEIDGNTLRAKRLYIGTIVERPLADIDCLSTMLYPIRNETVVILESLLGRVKGIEICFKDRRTPLRVMRADPAMSNALEFMTALLDRMSILRPIETEMSILDGVPIVRSVYWQDIGSPPPRRSNAKKVVVAVFIFMAMMFGTGMSFYYAQEDERRTLSDLPPHRIELRDLLKNGPGPNRHVIITGTLPGNGVESTTQSGINDVYIALFPVNIPPNPKTDIQAVFFAKGAVNVNSVRMEIGRTFQVEGICSKSASTRWGTQLGPEILKANPGAVTLNAWTISEMQPPSSPDFIATLKITAISLLCVVILLSVILWLMRNA